LPEVDAESLLARFPASPGGEVLRSRPRPDMPASSRAGLRDVCVASLPVLLALVNPCWRVIRRVRDAERRSVPISFRNARARRGTQARLRRRTNRSWLSI